MPAPNPCPLEDEVACFLEGQASPSLTETILGHIESCTRCRVLLARLAHSFDSAASDEGPLPIPCTFAAGAVVGGRYQVDRFVARGGMGEVYAATDLELKETVALKTLVCTSLDDARLANRIRAEVRLARRITHPNVCRILEFGVHRQRHGTHEESIPFFTMEFLNGETLAAYLGRHGRLVQSDALAIAGQILDGLAAIHAAGIVHRDLKPENVFIPRGAACGVRAIVMDFGLARQTDARSSGISTTGGAPLGTPAYMAPEQALGGAPTTAWDIYAFGLLLFKLVSGELPFEGESPAAVALARVYDGAPSLSSRVRGVRSGLDAIVARCLHRDPARRFASTEDLRRAFAKLPADSGRRRMRAIGPISLLLVLALGCWWLAATADPALELSLPVSPPAMTVLFASPPTIPAAIRQLALDSPRALPRDPSLSAPSSDRTPQPGVRSARPGDAFAQAAPPRPTRPIAATAQTPTPSSTRSAQVDEGSSTSSDDEVVIPSFAKRPTASPKVRP